MRRSTSQDYTLREVLKATLVQEVCWYGLGPQGHLMCSVFLQSVVTSRCTLIMLCSSLAESSNALHPTCAFCYLTLRYRKVVNDTGRNIVSTYTCRPCVL